MRSWVERHQVLAVALAGGALYVAWIVRDVLIVLFLGYILAAALRPAVDWLVRWRVPRLGAIALLYVGFIGGLGWLLGSAIPPLIAEGQSFALRLSSLSQQVSAHLRFISPDQLSNLINFLQTQAAQVAASSVVVLGGLITALIISMYLLYDWHRLHERGSGVGGRLYAAVREADIALGAWARGQVLLSASVGLLSFAVLMVLGVEFAPVLAVLAFIFEFVPYAGPFLGGAPAVLIALNESTTTAVLVVIAYTVIQQLEAHLLVPLIMRRAVDLHPVVVIAVMLAGFEILGLPGVLLAVPLTVVARIMGERFWHA